MALPQSFPENTDVTLTVPLVDLNGQSVTNATAVSYRVTDSSGNELQALQAVGGYEANSPSVSVTIPAALNILPTQPVFTPGQAYPDKLPLRMVNVVEVQATTPAGVVICKGMYSVLSKAPLQVAVNSFQTIEDAILRSYTMPELDAWSSATQAQQIAAMIEAYGRLIKIGYRVKMNGWGDSPPAGYTLTMPWLNGDWIITPRIWPIMQADWFERYPQHFRESITRAQIAEADIILGSDEPSAKRSEGYMSETIGQTSRMFRPGKPLVGLLPISKQAADYLTNYIEWRMTITRS
jgi:hypothetical protein